MGRVLFAFRIFGSFCKHSVCVSVSVAVPVSDTDKPKNTKYSWKGKLQEFRIYSMHCGVCFTEFDVKNGIKSELSASSKHSLVISM